MQQPTPGRQSDNTLAPLVESRDDWGPALYSVTEEIFKTLSGPRFGEKLVPHRNNINLIKVHRNVESDVGTIGRRLQYNLQRRRVSIVSIASRA